MRRDFEKIGFLFNVFCFVVWLSSCRSYLNKSDPEKPQKIKNVELVTQQVAGKSQLKDLKINLVEGKSLAVVESDIKIENFRGNDYPHFFVTLSERAEFTLFKVCQNQHCIEDYSSNPDFYFYGLDRIAFQIGIPVQVSLRACVDPIHAEKPDDFCGSERILTSPLGKIADANFDALLGKIADERAQIKKNAQELSKLIEDYLGEAKSEGETTEIANIAFKLGAYSLGEVLADSPDQFVSPGLFLAGLHGNTKASQGVPSKPALTEKKKSSSEVLPIDIAQANGCFTYMEWEKLSKDEQCRLKQSIFYNQNNLNQCSLGNFSSSSQNNPRWFFSTGNYLCSDVDNCHVHPSNVFCPSSYTATCTCDPEPFETFTLAKVKTLLSPRAKYMNSLNTWDKCVSTAQVEFLLSKKQNCLPEKEAEHLHDQFKTGSSMQSVGTVVFVSGLAISGIAATQDRASFPELHKYGIMSGVVLSVLGAALYAGGMAIENNSNKNLMKLAGDDSRTEKLKELAEKNTKSALKLRELTLQIPLEK